jgi:hypothetical protein
MGRNKVFDVRLVRVERRYYHLRVEASSRREARRLALEQAGDIDFHEGSCSDPKFGVEEVNEEAGEPNEPEKSELGL